jgi:hypothetical protein
MKTTKCQRRLGEQAKADEDEPDGSRATVSRQGSRVRTYGRSHVANSYGLNFKMVPTMCRETCQLHTRKPVLDK